MATISRVRLVMVAGVIALGCSDGAVAATRCASNGGGEFVVVGECPQGSAPLANNPPPPQTVLTTEDAKAIQSAIDPEDVLTKTQRSMYAFQKGYEYYRDRADTVNAIKYAAAWVNVSAEASQQLGAQIQAMLNRGDPQGFAKKLLQVYAVSPSDTYHSDKYPDGEPRIVLRDVSGNVLGDNPITPAAIFNMANRTTTGAAIWGLMLKAAQGGYVQLPADFAKEAAAQAQIDAARAQERAATMQSDAAAMQALGALNKPTPLLTPPEAAPATPPKPINCTSQNLGGGLTSTNCN